MGEADGERETIAEDRRETEAAVDLDNAGEADRLDPLGLDEITVGKKSRSPIVGDAGITLQLKTNLFLGSKEMGERILRRLIDGGDVFIPEKFDGGKLTDNKKVPFDPQNLTLPLEGWADERYSLGIIAERLHPVKSSLHVSSTDFLMFDSLDLSIDTKWFIDKRFIDKNRLDKLVNVARDLYSVIGATSGYIQNWRDERGLGELTDDQGNLIGYRAPKVRNVLPGIFWANFFGPEYVEMFGRNMLDSAPWHKTENLPDGGVLAFVSESPSDASTAEYRVRKKELYAHSGENAFRDTLPKFRTEGRKKRDARPLLQSGGVRDDVFR
jgi:hypothetical protein